MLRLNYLKKENQFLTILPSVSKKVKKLQLLEDLVLVKQLF